MATARSRVITCFDDLVECYCETPRDFFFIQVGANDGKVGDPLYRYVVERGWCGVLIEPQAEVYRDRLLKTYAGVPGLSFESAAISEFDGSVELFKLSFSTKRWATGLASLKRKSLLDALESGYIEEALGQPLNSLPCSPDQYIVSESVRAMTFSSLLDKYRPESIDLLQMDAEGYDSTLLRLFDFDRIRPSIVQFESHLMSPRELLSSLRRVSDHGYISFLDGINTVAVLRSVAVDLDAVFEVEDLRVSPF